MKILILFSVLLIFEVYSENVENVTSSTETTTTNPTQITSVTLEEKDAGNDSNNTEATTVHGEKMSNLNEEITDPFERLLDDTRLLRKQVALNKTAVDDILQSSEFLKGWNLFKELNNKKYKSVKAETLRKKIFLANMNKIEKHNMKYEAGLVTYKMGINEYADMQHNEFIKWMTGIKIRLINLIESWKRSRFTITRFIPPKSTSIPDVVDWRNEGAVTEVKDQGKCGSCWAFSTTGTLEGQLFRKSGKLVPLSEQNLMDCSYTYGNQGCNGGLMLPSYMYIHKNGGIASAESYPYEAKTNKCRYKKSNKAVTVKGMMDIEPGNEAHLKIATATSGPISVAIDASSEGFQFYRSGVLNDKTCSKSRLNHGVLIVGYGTDEIGGDYWLVKNSWGVNWGDNGYIKMARNKNNQCGIAQMTSYPLI